MGEIVDIICYISFLKAGVWTAESIKILFDNEQFKEFPAITPEGQEIHIPDDCVHQSYDERLEETNYEVLGIFDEEIKKIVMYQAKWKKPPYKIHYMKYL
jgi:hypothetical protein